MRPKEDGAANATDPSTGENNGSSLGSVTDPAGIRTELSGQPPDFRMSTAIASSK